MLNGIIINIAHYIELCYDNNRILHDPTFIKICAKSRPVFRAALCISLFIFCVREERTRNRAERPYTQGG